MPQTPISSADTLLAELRHWGEIETPTTDPQAVNRLMDVAEGGLAEARAALTRIHGRNGYGENLLARTPGSGKPILVIGHLDTVWSHGSLAYMPYRVDGDAA